MTPFLRRFQRDDSGVAAVEFALVLPLLLAIVFGIICFGQYFAIANSLQQLAAEAARHSTVGLTKTNRENYAYAFIANAGARFTFLGSDRVTSLVSVEDGTVPGIEVALTYDLTGTSLEIADGFLGLGMTTITRRSYLAY